jgi:hypothetical protein
MFIEPGCRVDCETKSRTGRSLSVADKAAWRKLEKQTSRPSITLSYLSKRVSLEGHLDKLSIQQYLLRSTAADRGIVYLNRWHGARAGHDDGVPRGRDAVPFDTLSAATALQSKRGDGVDSWVSR